MDSFSPQDRALFETEASELYQEIVTTGGLSADDARIRDGGDRAEAFALLHRLNLVSHDLSTGLWQALDPATVHSQVVSPLGLQAAELLAESSSWAKAFGALDQAWRRAARSPNHGPFTYLHMHAIDPYIAGLVADCEEEMLTAQPQTGRDLHLMAKGVLRDTALLERGAKIRTLYQHSARRNAITRKYVAAVTQRGAEVRTLDEFFNRMIVIDRRVAVIPSPEDLKVAVAVREPSVVAYLVDVFERSWERARQFTSTESDLVKNIAAEQRAMTLRMLVEGHSDPVSAKRVGVSPRTYAGYISDLKEEFEVETRFQLGYVIGRRGISGAEPISEADEA